MEIVSIMLSFPVSFGLSFAYFAVLGRALRRFPRIAPPLTGTSALVLAVFGIEVLLIRNLGVVRTDGLLGPVFGMAHLAVFFLGVPALANLLVIRFGPNMGGWLWFMLALVCASFALVLVLLQYHVAETLFGVD